MQADGELIANAIKSTKQGAVSHAGSQQLLWNPSDKLPKIKTDAEKEAI